MDAFRPADWHDFFVATAGASAALTGLLFVGLSLHIRYIAPSRMYRGMARGSLIGLIMVLVLSLVALMQQPVQWTGVEVALACAVYIAGVSAFLVVTYRRLQRPPPAYNIVTAGLGFALSLLGIVAGASLFLQVGPGLYLVAFTIIAIVIWNLRDAWFLLLGVADAEILNRPTDSPD